MGFEQTAEKNRNVPQLLRLDREHDDIGRGCSRQLASDMHAVFGLERGTAVVIEFDHHDVGSGTTLSQQAGNNGAGHVATADKADFHVFS